MEKSTKILIGVGVVGIVGLLVYKKAKAAPSLNNSGTIPKKPITKPSVPSNPIIDPNTGKLTPPETKDTTDPNTNPKFDTSKGGGSGGSGGGAKGGGGSAGGPNNPDLNSGKFAKVDPNKKDENWIKALQKKQQKGGETKKGKKTPKVDCSANPYDPTCQKVKDCYYNPSDPVCSYGEYDYSGGDDSGYYYSGYDNNKYDYSYDDGGEYSGYDYNAGGGGGYYGGPSYYGGYFYSGNYGYSYYSGGVGGGASGGRGGNPSDYYY